MLLEFFIPGIPIAKGRPRFVRATGRTYTPEATMAGERNIAYFAAAAMRGRPLFSDPLELHIVATYLPPKSRTRAQRALPWAPFRGARPDVDNILKALLDACNGVVWVDDAIVASVRVAKVYGEQPGINVTLHELSPDSWPFARQA